MKITKVGTTALSAPFRAASSQQINDLRKQKSCGRARIGEVRLVAVDAVTKRARPASPAPKAIKTPAPASGGCREEPPAEAAARCRTRRRGRCGRDRDCRSR